MPDNSERLPSAADTPKKAPPKPEDLYREGLLAAQRYDFSTAIENLLQIKDQDGSESEYFSRLQAAIDEVRDAVCGNIIGPAALMREERKFDEALDLLMIGFQIMPTHYGIIQEILICLKELGDLEMLETMIANVPLIRKKPGLLDLVKAKGAVQPNRNGEIMRVFVDLRRRGKLEELVRYLEGELSRTPGNKHIRYHLAKAYQESGNLKAAQMAFLDLLQEAPKNLAYIDILINIGLELGEREFTAEIIHKKLQIRPEDGFALSVRESLYDSTRFHEEGGLAEAQVLRQKGDYRKALTLLLKEYRWNPQDLLILTEIALCFLKQNDHSRAQKALKKALFYYPDDAAALSLFGESLYHCREYHRAMPHLKKVHAIEPDNAKITKLLQRCRQRIQHPKDG